MLRWTRSATETDLAAPGALEIDASIKIGDTIALFTQKGELVGFAESSRPATEIYKLSNGIVAKTTRVFMERGTYPKMWGEV